MNCLRCLSAAVFSIFFYVGLSHASDVLIDEAFKAQESRVVTISRLKETEIYFVSNRLLSIGNSNTYQNSPFDRPIIDYDKIFTNNIGVANIFGKASVGYPADRNLSEQTYSSGVSEDNPFKNFSLESVSYANDPSVWHSTKVLQDISLHGKDVMVYVHGFVTSFSKSVAETAQLKNDLSFVYPVVLFSWPSDVGIFSYPKAIQREAISADFLSSAFQAISQARVVSGPEISGLTEELIAHSMGAKLALNSLFSLHEIWSRSGTKLNNLILAAADVNLTKFGTRDLPIIGEYARKTFVLCSDSDVALVLSQYMNPEDPPGQRLGRCFSETDAFKKRSLTVVHFNGGLHDDYGHSYFLNNEDTLRNIREQLQAPPKE